LVATDVLSEGQNLQDGFIVVNFDLPWTIIRLIQRAGRVDRIGQKSDKILCYSALPADGIETIIGLRAKVRWGPGAATYTYDSKCGSYKASAGDLTKKVDNAGNTTCYQYDSLHRMTDAGGGSSCRHFKYDSATPPTGVTVSNALGRMVEAYTDSCSGSKITDEWFSYDGDGNMTDMWEKTPNSTQYYHSNAAFAANGAATSLSLILPSSNLTASYYLDGEGRLSGLVMQEVESLGHTHLMGPRTTLVSSTQYNPASQPLNIAIGSSTDYDSYSYDPNTNRMIGWTFQVGSTPVTQAGALQWNPNGTLNNLAITDGFNATTQVCNYNPPSTSGMMGYDDLGRLLNVGCGPQTGDGTIWNQTFSYDPYGNLTKSTTGPGQSWNPGYNSATNRYAPVSMQYDSNGNLTYDSSGLGNSYSYDAFGKLVKANAQGTNCANGGECIIYDALGRAVEIDSGSMNTEIWYTQLGKTAYMNGGSYKYSYWPAPGGATVLDVDEGYQFLHRDWLGNARISSNILAQSITMDQSFAPFGEMYSNSNSSANENIFTGDTQDIMATGACCFDTPARELSANQGRWLSPDPAGLGAVNLTNPQSWNRYAYVLNNPLQAIDPLGLDCVYLNDEGNGVEEIDHTAHYLSDVESQQAEDECWSNGGYWANGNVAKSSWVQTFSDSDNIIIGSDLGGGFLAQTLAGSESNGGDAFSQQFSINVPVDTILTNIPNSLPSDALSPSGQAAANAISRAFRNFPNVCGVGAAIYVGKGKVGIGVSADTQNGVHFAGGFSFFDFGGAKTGYTISGGANGNISYSVPTPFRATIDIGTGNGNLMSIQSVSLSSKSSGWRNLTGYANLSNMGDPNCK